MVMSASGTGSHGTHSPLKYLHLHRTDEEFEGQRENVLTIPTLMCGDSEIRANAGVIQKSQLWKPHHGKNPNR